MGVGAGDGECRVERETGLDFGTCLVESIKLCQSGRQLKVREGQISVGFDRPSKPRDRLVPGAELGLRIARETFQA